MSNAHVPVRKRIRLRNYDYASAAGYFVTVCTSQRQPLLGAIVAGLMRASAWGEIAERCWHELPSHFSSVELDEFQAMPNHFHAVLVIVGRPEGPRGDKAGADRRFGEPQAGSLGTIVGALKSAATKRIGVLAGARRPDVWQPRFYDHVVRNEPDLARIREYVASNPLRWHLDRHNPQRSGEDEFDRWLDSLSATRPESRG